jgi:hypothetical protein
MTTHQVLRYLDFHRTVGKSENGNELSDSVRTVVEGEQSVALCLSAHITTIRTLNPRLLGPADDGLDELVCDVLGIALLNSLDEVIGRLSNAGNQSLDSELDSVPSLITVHSVVSADNSRQLSDAILRDEVLYLLDVGGGRPWGGITSISEEVDVDFGDPMRLGDLEKGKEMVDVRVDTTVGNQTEEVETTRVGLGMLHALDNSRLILELILLDA